ncbi:MAG: hypothetical protein II718_08500 [Clostridiales bacterium]|nr:hypothetical protein [Clostridiales bacterium]
MKDKLKCFKTLTGSILSLAFVLGAVPFMGTEVKADDVVYKWGFEDGLEDWISIDADGDGYDWFRYGTSDVYADNDNPEYYVHTGNDSIMSLSYEKENNKVLDPDNWLISPKVPLGGYISFYANAIDDSYPDHIGVFVTTGERDNLDSYCLVDAWDLEDWSTGNEVASSVWEQYTVSLEEFEGEGYVAIRHFNSRDKFVLAVDDVEIGGQLDDIEAVISGFEGEYDGEQHGITVDVTSPDSYKIRYGTEEGSYIFDETPKYIVPGTYTVYYRITAEGYMPLQGSETIVIEETTGMIYQDFEDDYDDWTLIDRDNDGENWFQGSIQENNNLLASLSQSYGGEGLDPDNWAISPAVKLGGSVSFYGRNVLSGYADHIGVYVTTGDIDDLDSYELIDDFVPPSEWTYYTFDLSDYSGEGYIAIRHYDSSNQYAALIDDIVILPGQAAPEGWVQEGDLWFYFEDGEAVTGWKKIENVWYFFGEDGAMTTGWLKDGDSWYYFKSSGAMAKGWTKISGKWYYFTSGGKMKTGWLQDGSKWYYLKSSGAMATGWTKVSGKWYFMGTDGVMKTGWVQDAGKWYYMDSNGTMHTGWLQIGAKWYYLNSSGVMVTGTQTINGKTYTFDSNGVWIS